jgi:hypothetical protein
MHKPHGAACLQVGTALFVAPEVMHNFNNAPYDGAAVDVWAAGIVLFILLFGRHPFLRPEDSALPEQQQMLALFTRTAASQFCLLPEEALAITPACADLLSHVLQTNPASRCAHQAHTLFSAPCSVATGLSCVVRCGGFPSGAVVQCCCKLKCALKCRGLCYSFAIDAMCMACPFSNRCLVGPQQHSCPVTGGLCVHGAAQRRHLCAALLLCVRQLDTAMNTAAPAPALAADCSWS